MTKTTDEILWLRAANTPPGNAATKVTYHKNVCIPVRSGDIAVMLENYDKMVTCLKEVEWEGVTVDSLRQEAKQCLSDIGEGE